MARIKKAQIAAMQASPEDVEQQFYEAMREGNIDKLMAVWAEDEEVVCIHPGGPRLVGPAAVRSSFEALFSGGPIGVRPDNVRRVHSLGTAVHSVVEKVHIKTAEGLHLGHVMATNVYIKTGLGWRMVTHHASRGTPGEPPEPVETPSVLH